MSIKKAIVVNEGFAIAAVFLVIETSDLVQASTVVPENSVFFSYDKQAEGYSKSRYIRLWITDIDSRTPRTAIVGAGLDGTSVTQHQIHRPVWFLPSGEAVS